MPTTMGIAGEDEHQSSESDGVDQDQRGLVFARLAELDVITADDEEEISRFRAFVAAPAPRHRVGPWLRRRPALPL